MEKIKRLGKDTETPEEERKAQLQQAKLWKKHKTTLLSSVKKTLTTKLEGAAGNNSKGPSKRIRQLSAYALVDKNVVSIFTSALTRTFGMEAGELSTNIIIVRVYYVSVLEDIMVNGFQYNGEEYCFFSASAGQIRQKKSMFVKKELWQKHEKALMCGLSMEDINGRGGINVNKFLAYLALSNSATDVWEGFDMRKTIVIDDFTTPVTGTVDYIDDATYTVERKEMAIAIEHSDGCGMILPRLSPKNRMVRAPFIKGLLAVFDFQGFIQKYCEGGECVVEDIYGVKHRIIEEDIQVVFTKSQFKLWAYYDSWEAYIEYFQTFHCEIGYCNEENSWIPDARINYQMLQSLHGMTEDELSVIANKSKARVDGIAKNVATMLDALGANKPTPAPYQEAVKVYPPLLRDEYFKKVLREKKASMVQDYRAGRLEVNGKYLFLVPDLFAACQQWFLQESRPSGLLADGEVFCRVYRHTGKLDVLRSPHLYKEHPVKNNVVDPEKEAWFITDAIYTSSHDLISKYLMFDNDGDKALVVADKTIVACAERHMEGVVPLYYDMKKAGPNLLCPKVMYEGMRLAYRHSDIGSISNDITRIWNQDVITEESILAIKLLCCDNNFSIDAAKTLYMPTRTAQANELIKGQIRAGLPHFFMYLKGKNKGAEQVAPANKSTVNRIAGIIVNRRITYPKNQLDALDYRVLMKNPDIAVDGALTKAYFKLNCTYHFKINHRDPDDSNISYISKTIKERLSGYGYDEATVADMLVKYSYATKTGKGKAALWFCYGDIIVDNIKRNLAEPFGVCGECGARLESQNSAAGLCGACGKEHSHNRQVTCCDCGVTVTFKRGGAAPKRCRLCAGVKQRGWQRHSMKKQRLKTRSEVD